MLFQVLPLGGVLHAITPVRSEIWWYLSAYFPICFLFPFFNMLIERMTKREGFLFVSLLLAIFSIYGVMSKFAFGQNDGYSFLWLSVLYFAGAYYHKIEKDIWFISIKDSTVLYSFVTLVLFLLQIVLPIILPGKNEKIINSCFSYLSPIIVVQSVALLTLFAQLRIKSYHIKKWIEIISPLTFSIYLIHVKKPIYDLVLPKICGYAIGHSIFYLPICVLGAIGVFGVCGCIEFGREQVFKLFKLNSLMEKMSSFVQKRINQIIDRIIQDKAIE